MANCEKKLALSDVDIKEEQPVNTLLENLDAIDAFINGTPTKSLDKSLAIYDYNIPLLDEDFHQTKGNHSEEINKRLTKILASLNISPKEQEKFNLDVTIHDFLATLAKQGHPQLCYIVDQLDNKKRFRFVKLLLGPGIGISIFATVFSIAGFHLLLEFIRAITSSLIAFPIIGLISNTFFNIYYIGMNHFDNKKSRANRMRDLFFILSSAAINIAAYSFLLATSVAASPVAAGLFVANAVYNVIKEIICLIQEMIVYKSRPFLNENNNLYDHKAHARREYEYQKRINAIAINLVAALFFVGISILWGFVPGGLPVALISLTAMSVVALVRIFFIKYNEYKLRERLQTQLQDLNKAYNNVDLVPDNEENIDTSPDNLPAPQMQRSASLNDISSKAQVMGSFPPNKAQRAAPTSEFPPPYSPSFFDASSQPSLYKKNPTSRMVRSSSESQLNTTASLGYSPP